MPSAPTVISSIPSPSGYPSAISSMTSYLPMRYSFIGCTTLKILSSVDLTAFSTSALATGTVSSAVPYTFIPSSIPAASIAIFFISLSCSPLHKKLYQLHSGTLCQRLCHISISTFAKYHNFHCLEKTHHIYPY